MRCVAVTLGLVGEGAALHRVRPGEVFEADVCPSWARPAEPAKPVKAKTKRGDVAPPPEDDPLGE